MLPIHAPLFHWIILIAAFVFAILATFQFTTPRLNLWAMALALLILAFLVTGCASTPTQWQSQLAPDSLANKAVVNVANHYGGQKAAELASAGLYATADVLQGYVDKKPPIDVITQSPGVEGVGHLLVGYLKDKNVISQKTVDNINKAAAFAARVTYRPDPK